MSRDTIPIEGGILVDEIGGGGISELPIHADLFKFTKERIYLARIHGIAELSNEIRCLYQPGLQVVIRVARIDRAWKAGEFNRSRHPLCFDKWRILQPL